MLFPREGGPRSLDATWFARCRILFPYARQHGPQFLKYLRTSDPAKRHTRIFVFEELVFQEALRRKLNSRASKVNRAVADFRKQFDLLQSFRSISEANKPEV